MNSGGGTGSIESILGGMGDDRKFKIIIVTVVLLVIGAIVLFGVLRDDKTTEEPPLGGGGGVAEPVDPGEETEDPFFVPNRGEVAKPARDYIKLLYSFDSSEPYPGWDPEAFNGIVGGELEEQQNQRSLNIESPSVGDLDTYKFMRGRNQRVTVAITSTEVMPIEGRDNAWIVLMEFHTLTTNDALPGQQAGAERFASITVEKVGEDYLATSDSRPQAL